MSRWFRLYADLLDDPKVQRLPAPLFKTWINLLCLASRNDGLLPDVEDMAFALRMDADKLTIAIEDLTGRGLLDKGEDLRPHNWDERQFKSDKDMTAAERQKQKRVRDRERKSQAPVTDGVTRDVTDGVTDHVTRDGHGLSHPPEAEAEAEQKQSRAEAEPAEAGEGRAAACVEIGKRITDLMGVTNDPRWMGNWSIVSTWLAQGFDADLDILPTVGAMVDRLRRTQKPMPGSLKYFSRVIEENHQTRITSGKSPVPAAPTEFYSARKGTPQHRAWIAHYRKQGRKTAFYETQEFLTVPTEWPPPASDATA